MKLSIYYGALLAPAASAAFNWSTIPSSTELRFHPCFDAFQCARLVVPLDWLVPEDCRTATIAVTRLPAVVSRDDIAYAGAVIAQPGGPGTSGVLSLQQSYATYRDLIDIPGKRHYDLISFDPRGVNNTVPRVRCFTGLAANIRARELYGAGSIDVSAARLPILLARARADGEQCWKANGDVLSYVSTADTAKDMLAIVDGLEEELRRERRVDGARNATAAEDADVRLELRSSQEKTLALPRLNYIGTSYGTVLGNYFASMFPGRVGRMMLDGVVDAVDYSHEQRLLGDSRDTFDVFRHFFEACIRAGSRCALSREEDESDDDLIARQMLWLEKLEQEPLVVASPQGHRMILGKNDIFLHMVEQMHRFEDTSPFLATFLDDAMTKPSRLYEKYANWLLPVDPPANACLNDTFDPGNALDVRSAIACSDADDLTNRSFRYWSDYVDRLDRQLPIGWYGAVMRLPCSGWPVRARRPFKGPFGTPKPNKKLDEDSPAAPLLFVSNRWDHITPLAGAQSMSKLYPHSGLVIQEATGHCAILGPYGPCLKDIVSRYFDTGEVPQGETTCEAARHAWDEE